MKLLKVLALLLLPVASFAQDGYEEIQDLQTTIRLEKEANGDAKKLELLKKQELEKLKATKDDAKKKEEAKNAKVAPKQKKQTAK